MMADSHSSLPHRLVHLDLKGAPMRLDYMEMVFPFLKRWGATGLLVEYEDTFPYDGDLKILAASHAYSKEDVKQLLKLASENDLIVVPLVQCFGHLEFVLKHGQFSSLREVDRYPMALCPSKSDSISLVCQMIDQVMALHPNIQHFHIGCDEVFHLGLCERCLKRMATDLLRRDQMFFAHVRDVATHIRKKYPGITCIIWDDMFRFSELPVMLNCQLGDLVEPMVWHYLSTFMLPNDLWDKLSAVFPNIWVASAFKGATGPHVMVTNIRYHINNHHAWLETLHKVKHKFKNIQGIALTGWQRYDHYAVLCELFPQSIPCLALCLRFIQQGSLTAETLDSVCQELQFSSPLLVDTFMCRELPVSNFPGCQVYRLMFEYVHAEIACHEFFALEGIVAWMNEYNMDRGFINPVHVEPLLARAGSLLNRLCTIEERVDPAFTKVFVHGVAQEWIGTYLKPNVHRLESFMEKARKSIFPSANDPPVKNS